MNKNILYWSPYLGRVATIKSVINSMIGLKKFMKKSYDVSIINCYGEWDDQISNFKKNKIGIINLQKKIKFKTDLYGFIISRLIYTVTFLITYKKLKNLLIKKQPDFIIVHLLTFIPLFLFLNNKFKTKLILRISGKPKLSFFRFLLWKISNKNIHLVFCPTEETKNHLLRTKIFDKKKIKYLPDPILHDNEIKELSKKKAKYKFKKNSYFLSIGRLTKQKNHELLINMFNFYKLREKLVIIGDGELFSYLKNLIIDLKLEKKIQIINYQKNIFDYIKRSKAVIIPSLWEDPGFVMIETAYLKKPIICSNCPSGPKEFIGKNKGGFLFKSNSLTSLINSFENFFNSSKADLNKKIQFAKNQSKIYSIENHTKIISRYLG